MLQTQMKAAGSTDEAANNLANLLSKITSEDSKAKFAKKGIDLTESMQAAIATGLDPITAFLQLIQESTRQADPAKAAQMVELQKQIADAQDPAAAQKMLNGYLEIAGLSEFISDRQAKQAALAVLQNQKLHESNLRLIQAADGEAKIEKDLADRRATSAQKWREAGQAFDEAMVSIGDALRPITDTVATGLIKVGQTISMLANQFPGVTQGVLGLASAFAIFKSVLGIFKIASGILNILRGGLMAAGGAKIGGALNLAGAGGAAASGGLAVAGKVFPLLGALTGGYAIGTGISSLIDKGLSKMTGENTTLGGWIFDKLHPEQAAAAKAMTAPSTQNNTFSPSIQVTVNGDVKDPRQVANEILPHLRRLFEQDQSRTLNAAMFDSAHSN